MKGKAISILVAACLVLALVAIPFMVGCAEPAPEFRFDWGDVPIYEGAVELVDKTYELPAQPGQPPPDYEARVFALDASIEDVQAFYEAQMPANGWESLVPCVSPSPTGTTWGCFWKKADKVAGIQIDSPEGEQWLILVKIQEPPEPAEPPPPPPEPTESVFNWDDFPVYEGAVFLADKSYPLAPGPGGAPEAQESRVYALDASIEDIQAFYEAAASENDWGTLLPCCSPSPLGTVLGCFYYKGNENFLIIVDSPEGEQWLILVKELVEREWD